MFQVLYQAQVRLVSRSLRHQWPEASCKNGVCVGICHSDLHSAKGEWGDAIFPMVPGHEIIGVVTEVGKDVKSFKVGERAGVGCFVDSCRQCNQCHGHEEQFCQEGMVSFNSFYVVRLSYQNSVMMRRKSEPILHISLQKWPRFIIPLLLSQTHPGIKRFWTCNEGR